MDSLLEAGIKQTLDQNYDEAKETFIYLNNKFSGIPLGKIFTATVYVAEAFDYSSPFQTDSINYYIDAARKQSGQLVDEDGRNVWNLYSLAFAEGFHAYFEALNNNWIEAFTNGLNSIDDFQKCLAIDPDFYEAYTAIGTYKYWRSRKTKIASWLTFFPDGEEAGIKYLKLALEHASYTRYFALNSLIWIYIDRKDFSDAEKLAESALKKYPDNRQFKLEYARTLEDSDPQKAIKIYFEVIKSYSRIKNLNRCNQIELKHIIALRYYRIGNYKDAQKLCEEILGIKDLTAYEKEKLKGRLERVKELDEKIKMELQN